MLLYPIAIFNINYIDCLLIAYDPIAHIPFLLPWGLGPPAPQWVTAAAVGPGAAQTAMGRRRRRRGAWGRPQRVPVKSLNYKEKIEMREMPKKTKT